ncbi:hypothetical protein BVI434_850110 [Burkholderia vietnamiensis]|nr:hypothetical protein BVI434_850110 [Burkholderia vietnamiensis]
MFDLSHIGTTVTYGRLVFHVFLLVSLTPKEMLLVNESRLQQQRHLILSSSQNYFYNEK